MITKSGRSDPAGRPPAVKTWAKLQSPSWHAVCIAPFAGCFYLEPAARPEVNQPPEILFPDPGAQHLLDLDQFSQVSVTVRESDGDQVLFIWTIPDVADALITDVPQDADEWTSVLRVQNKDTALNGREVRCTILDEASPANRLELTWRIQVGGP